MTYIPRRTARYHYLWEMIHDVEDSQCRTCVFSKLVTDPGQHAEEYPMCWEIEGELCLEEPVEALDEDGAGMVTCTLYRNIDRAQEAKNQESLFND